MENKKDLLFKKRESARAAFELADADYKSFVLGDLVDAGKDFVKRSFVNKSSDEYDSWDRFIYVFDVDSKTALLRILSVESKGLYSYVQITYIESRFINENCIEIDNLMFDKKYDEAIGNFSAHLKNGRNKK